MTKTIRTAGVLICLLLIRVQAQSEPFQAGVAVIDITPPVPYRMSGYFSERLSTGIKDPLQAKAVVFSQGSEQAALVFCDLIGISPDVAANTRKRASELTGIPADNIAICATHSHTGPLYWGALRQFLHERAIERHGSDEHETVDYPSQLVERLVAVIQQAQANGSAVKLSAGYATETRLSFNRRFHMKNGTVRFNPGQQNPDIVRVAGPIDPQVGIIGISPVDELASKPNSAIISYALHLDTVGGTEYSADYPKYLEDALRERLGPSFVSMFGTGTCGDINHIDVSIKSRRSAKQIGTMLGKTVIDKLPDLVKVSDLSLGVRRAVVEAPLQTFSEDRIARARREMQFVDNARKMSFLDRVETYKINAIQMRDGETLDLEVQAFRLGPDLAIVTLPGEVFVELGQAIKAASRFSTTLVIELANDAPGYIPTRKAFAEGSYETVNSRVVSGSGESMVNAAIQLLDELK